jgi:hypothetical protein
MLVLEKDGDGKWISDVGVDLLEFLVSWWVGWVG